MMDNTFVAILVYSILVMIGLSLVAGAFVFLGKFFNDISEDPDAEAH
jgi:Ca2+/H+ antiporter